MNQIENLSRNQVCGYNRGAWDKQVEDGNPWTIPVGEKEIAMARQGNWRVVLTPTVPVPREWFPVLEGRDVLCLASGGGQQGPILAAAGANVTVLDNSPRQLAQDRLVAERESLELTTIQGDMAHLHMFPNESFDLVFHPVSNLFVPEVLPVWKEAFRVLRRAGVLLAGFANPAMYLFDHDLADQAGVLQVKYALPYSDVDSLSEEKKRCLIEGGEPLEFGHTLADQLGGQLDAGFIITGFYEDGTGDPEHDIVSRFMKSFVATRAVKP